MNPIFLTARAAFATAEPLSAISSDAAEGDLQWMPPGPQTITCWVNGKPRRLSFTVTAQAAGLLDAQLQKMLAKAKAGTGDKPLTDYNHDDGAASSRPRRLEWAGDDPKAGGIRLITKWTGKARSAIRDEEFDRFSPQWDFDENTGEIVGIGVNLGGLVNKAAFQQIATVKARDASGAELKGEGETATSNTEHSTSNIEFDCDDVSAAAHKASGKAYLASAEDAVGAHTDAHKKHLAAAAAMKAAGNSDEAAAHKDLAAIHKTRVMDITKTNLAAASAAASNANQPGAQVPTTTENEMTDIEIATAVAKGVEAATKPLADTIKGLSDKLGQLETSSTAQAKNAATASAKSAVARHVARGAIAPQDTKAIEFWEASHVANAANAEEQLAKLAAPTRGRVIQSGTETGTAAGEDPDTKIIAAGAALHAKNGTAIASDAAGLEAYLKTPAGNAAYAESLRARSPRRHDAGSAR